MKDEEKILWWMLVWLYDPFYGLIITTNRIVFL